MGCRFVITPNATNQISSAINYYTTQSRKIGEEFLLEIDEQINKIANGPEIYKLYYGNYRMKLLDRYPYSLFYIFNNRKSLVEISILHHQRQDPNILQRQLN